MAFFRRHWPGFLIAILTFVHAWVAYRPSKMYFYADAWPIFIGFHHDGIGHIWSRHNEHFQPLAQLSLYLVWRVFGMQPLAFQVLCIVTHVVTTLVLFRLTGVFASAIGARVFATGLFALCTIPWQIIQWEGAHCIGQALFFLLLSLVCFDSFLRTRNAAQGIACVAAGLAATLSMTFGLLVIPLLLLFSMSVAGPWKTSLRIAFLICGAIFALYAGLALLSHVGLLPPQPPEQSVFSRLGSLPAWMIHGFWSGLLRPIWAGSPPLFLLTSTAFVWALAVRRDWRLLLTPGALILATYALAGAGRAGFGLDAALMSRYQYYPLAGLALAAAFSLQPVADQLRGRKLLSGITTALGCATLGQFAVFGVQYVTTASNHMAYASSARYFVNRAVWRSSQPQIPANHTRLNGDFLLPPVLFWGTIRLAEILPLFGPEAVQPDAANGLLVNQIDLPELQRQSLVPAVPDPGIWKSSGGAVAGSGGRITLPPNAAVELEIDACCDSGPAYTFVMRAAGLIDPQIRLRLEFFASNGQPVTSVTSGPVTGAHTLEVSAYAHELTSSTRASILNVGAESRELELKAVYAWRHPVFVPTAALRAATKLQPQPAAR